MAAGIDSNFTIYNDEIQTGFAEVLNQETDAFNAASNGAITLTTRVHEGYYARRAFFKALSSAAAISRRDHTDTLASPIADNPLTEDEFVGVKLLRKIGPITQTRGAFRRIGMDPGELAVIVGQNAAKATAMNMLNTSLLAACAALGNQAAVTLNITALSPSDFVNADVIFQMMAKAGDSAGDIRLWVMHSASYYSLLRDQATTYKFDAVAGVNIATGTAVTMGRPVLITDSPSLFANASPKDTARVLGLREGAIQVENSELQDMVVQDVTDREQLAIRVHGELAYDVSVKGFKWNIAAGGANPLDAALGTGSNWPAASTSYKDFAGVICLAHSA